MILINRDDHPGGPINVAVDNGVAAREALHMLARCGCRRIAVVSSTAGTPSLVARERAFADAAAERSIETSVVRAGPTGYAAGFEAGRILLSGSARPDAAFCVIAWRGLRIASRAQDAFGAFLALGITTMIGVQALVNMSVVLGLMPTKGIPLPLVSNGGSSMLINLLGVGVLLNISQHAHTETGAA